MTDFSPREIVSELDRCIVGQKEAKRAVALAAARALAETELPAEEIVRRSMRIAGEICVYTNANVVIESIEA